ncbi:hypothetical protein MA16_Dca013930 [Dendrobium catenatum]|uniref:Uncharacterized protein n=1 Tax=Dendrobium catenatum TaxID=906689 RepID=A0A2I0XGE2_9ASPA|nr:hypothetical protein MA16_Dca013930 [Dendrobium catenatum]
MAFGHFTRVADGHGFGDTDFFVILGDVEKRLWRGVTETTMPHVRDVLYGKKSKMVCWRFGRRACAEGIKSVNTRTLEKTAVGRTILNFIAKRRESNKTVIVTS